MLNSFSFIEWHGVGVKWVDEISVFSAPGGKESPCDFQNMGLQYSLTCQAFLLCFVLLPQYF